MAEPGSLFGSLSTSMLCECYVEAIKARDHLRAEVERLTRERDEAERNLCRWRAAIQELTPGGSEYMDPEAVKEFARQQKQETAKAKLDAARARKEAAEARAAAIEEAAKVIDAVQPYELPCSAWEAWNSAKFAALNVVRALAAAPEAEGTAP